MIAKGETSEAPLVTPTPSGWLAMDPERPSVLATSNERYERLTSSGARRPGPREHPPRTHALAETNAAYSNSFEV